MTSFPTRHRASLYWHKKLNNFMKNLNQVWWSCWNPAVTSLPPELSPHLDTKKNFDTRFEFYSLPVFQRTIARLCTSNKILNVIKTFFPGVDTFPTSPVTSLPTDFRVIHMQKKFFDVRFGMYSSIASQRAIARLYASNKILNVTKCFFLV